MKQRTIVSIDGELYCVTIPTLEMIKDALQAIPHFFSGWIFAWSEEDREVYVISDEGKVRRVNALDSIFSNCIITLIPLTKDKHFTPIVADNWTDAVCGTLYRRYELPTIHERPVAFPRDSIVDYNLSLEKHTYVLGDTSDYPIAWKICNGVLLGKAPLFRCRGDVLDRCGLLPHEVRRKGWK